MLFLAKKIPTCNILVIFLFDIFLLSHVFFLCPTLQQQNACCHCHPLHPCDHQHHGRPIWTVALETGWLCEEHHAPPIVEQYDTICLIYPLCIHGDSNQSQRQSVCAVHSFQDHNFGLSFDFKGTILDQCSFSKIQTFLIQKVLINHLNTQPRHYNSL